MRLIYELAQVNLLIQIIRFRANKFILSYFAAIKSYLNVILMINSSFNSNHLESV